MTPFLIVAQADTLELGRSAARQQGSPDSNITRCNGMSTLTLPCTGCIYVHSKLIGCVFDVEPKSSFECPT